MTILSRQDILRRLMPSRGTTLFLLLLITVASGARAQGMPPFGNRLGTGLDSLDLRYFGLFPSIPDISGARAEPLGRDSTLVTLRRASGDTVLRLPNDVMGELAAFIDNYELLPSGRIDLRWDLLRGLVVTTRWSVGAREDVIVTDRTGEPWRGRIAYVDDSLLALWTSDPVYRWREATDIRTFGASEIARVERRGSIAIGATASLLLAGTAGWFGQYLYTDHPSAAGVLPGAIWGITAGFGLGQLSALDCDIAESPARLHLLVPSLNDLSMFSREIPPELRRTIEGARARLASEPIEASTATIRGPRLHVGIAMGYVIGPTCVPDGPMDAQVDPIVAAPGSGAVARRTGEVVTMQVEYSLTGPIRLSAMLQRMMLPDSSIGTSFNGTTTGLGLEVAIIQPRLFPDHRIELVLGLGLASTSVSGYGTVWSETKYPESYPIDARTTVGTVHADLGIYATRNLSWHLAYDGTFGGGITLDMQSLPSFVREYDLSRGITSHDLDISSHSFSIGVKLHL